MGRAQDIVAFCKGCFGDDHSASARDVTTCPLWRYRMQREDKSAPGKRLTRGQAVKTFCVECMGGSRSLVHGCPSSSCVLYPHRLGHNAG